MRKFFNSANFTVFSRANQSAGNQLSFEFIQQEVCNFLLININDKIYKFASNEQNICAFLRTALGFTLSADKLKVKAVFSLTFERF